MKSLTLNSSPMGVGASRSACAGGAGKGRGGRAPVRISVIVPPRPANFSALIVVSPSLPRRKDGHGVASSSVMGIVARVRWDERSNVLLQFARFRRGTTESRSWDPAYSRPDERPVVVRKIGQMADADISDPATSTWYARLPHWHPW